MRARRTLTLLAVEDHATSSDRRDVTCTLVARHDRHVSVRRRQRTTAAHCILALSPEDYKVAVV